MRPCYRLSLIGLLVLLALEPTVAQPTGRFPSDFADALARRLDQLQMQHSLVGVAAAVVSPRHGVWVGTSGHENRETGDTIELDRLFGIGSVTKTFTSAAVLQLVQEGALRLGDTIGTWVGGYRNVDGAITVRQLLGHTAGLANYTASQAFWQFTDADLARVMSPEEILQFVGSPSFAPGTSWQYSNTNYLLLGMIIERVTGESLEDELERRFFSPLGLGSIAMGTRDALPGVPVTNWSDTDGDGDLDDFSGVPRGAIYSGAWAAGGLFASVRDLALWGDRLYTGTVLSQEMMTELLTFRTTSGVAGYGLGVMRGGLGGRMAWGHTGGIPGFSTALWHIPEDDLTIAVVINHSSPAAANIVFELMNEYYRGAVASAHSVTASGSRVEMHAAHPNPFTDITAIPVEPLVGTDAVVTVHGLLGTPVRTLLDGHMPAGARSLLWDGLDDAGNRLPPGVYIVRMQSGGATSTQRVIKR